MAKAWAKAFYNSRPWQAVRYQALKRDLFTCQLCGARAEEVHHLVELSPANISDPRVALNLDNLQSLCHDCHREITMEAHGLIHPDCDAGYFFDADGQLIKRSS